MPKERKAAIELWSKYMPELSKQLRTAVELLSSVMCVTCILQKPGDKQAMASTVKYVKDTLKINLDVLPRRLQDEVSKDSSSTASGGKSAASSGSAASSSAKVAPVAKAKFKKLG